MFSLTKLYSNLKKGIGICTLSKENIVPSSYPSFNGSKSYGTFKEIVDELYNNDIARNINVFVSVPVWEDNTYKISDSPFTTPQKGLYIFFSAGIFNHPYFYEVIRITRSGSIEWGSMEATH